MLKTTGFYASVILIITVLSLALSLIPAERAESSGSYYVRIDGSDSNDGSANDPAHAWRTIQHAIDVVSIEAPGSTIYVAAGTYYENLHINTDLNLAGAGVSNTTIDGRKPDLPHNPNGTVIRVSSAPYQRNVISGFTIQNGGPAGSDPGGGIYISTAHIVTINDCVIINNTKGGGSGVDATKGGGVSNISGSLTMNRCTIAGNTATSKGGGIYTEGGAGGDSGLAVINDCTVSDNNVTDSDGQGGGIWNAGTLTLNRSCLSGNHACRGSGIYNMPSATADLTNCTLSGNTGIGVGGGIRNWGIVRCLNITMSENRGSIGGAFSNDGAPARIYFKNSIVSNNTATTTGNNGYDTNSGAGIISEGRNIDSENTCNFNQPTDQRNTNPLLGPLQNNGGPTLTYAITSNSPAYNRGDNSGAPATDQRGVIRPQAGVCDIGAFELEHHWFRLSFKLIPSSPHSIPAWDQSPSIRAQVLSRV